MAGGRPTDYNDIIADEICDAIASSEKGLQHLCAQNPHWPTRQQIFVWLRKHAEFADKYTKAKSNQVEVSIDYMQELVNEPHHYIDDNHNERVDVGMLRTKIDAIKWQASKLAPKKYADKVIQEVTQTNTLEDINKRKETIQKAEKEY